MNVLNYNVEEGLSLIHLKYQFPFSHTMILIALGLNKKMKILDKTSKDNELNELLNKRSKIQQDIYLIGEECIDNKSRL